MIRLLASVSVAVSLALPVSAQDPTFVLTVPGSVSLGESFDYCIEAPGGSTVFLLASDTLQTTETKVGDLGIGFPFLAIFPIVMPASGVLCITCGLDCAPELDGFTAYLQFVAVGPAPGQVGISNVQSLTTEAGAACMPEGDFTTFTQGGWGQDCNGNNVGCLRDTHFDDVWPEGLGIGDADGIDGDEHPALLLTSSAAVQDFLPAGSTPGALDADAVNPAGSTAGVLAGQLIAAKLNVSFDDAGAFDLLKGQTDTPLGDLVFVEGCVHPLLAGMALRDVIDLADQAISGELAVPLDLDRDGEPDVSYSDLSSALDVSNNNFDDGTQNDGCLDLP